MKQILSKIERIAHRLIYGFMIPEYDGMMNGAKCRFLWRLVERYQGVKGSIVEIGSYRGCSTTWLGVAGLRAGFKELIAIDLFTGTPSWGEEINTYDVFSKRIAANNLASFVRPIVGDSKEVIKTLSLPQGIAILHIDGDHEYSAVKADIDIYAPLLNVGGVLIMDDYDSVHPDVIRATAELLESGRFKEIGRVKEIKNEGYGSVAFEKIKDF